MNQYNMYNWKLTIASSIVYFIFSQGFHGIIQMTFGINCFFSEYIHKKEKSIDGCHIICFAFHFFWNSGIKLKNGSEVTKNNIIVYYKLIFVFATKYKQSYETKSFLIRFRKKIGCNTVDYKRQMKKIKKKFTEKAWD